MFESVIWLCLNASAEAGRMRADRGHAGWCDALRGLAGMERLAPLRPALERIASEGLTPETLFGQFTVQHAATIPGSVYLAAADTALAQVGSSPQASWVLSAVALLGWDSTLGPGLIPAPRMGSAHLEAWARIPYACAATSLAIDATWAAEEILSAATPMLWVASVFGQSSQLRSTLDSHADLARRAARKMDAMVRDLSEDLRAACRESAESGLRPRITALLWALGYVPESGALRDSDMLPTRRLCRSLVRESLWQVGSDPIVQSLWFSLAESSYLPSRHEELFSCLLAPYRITSTFWDIAVLVLSPLVVARVLVDWCARRVPPNVAEWFISRCSLLVSMPDTGNGQADLLRIAALGLLLRNDVERAARAPDQISGTSAQDPTDAATDSGWMPLADGAFRAVDAERADVRRNQFTRALAIPFFGLIDDALSSPSPVTAKAVERLVEQVERLRCAPYRQLLTLTPALPPVVSSGDADSLLAERDDVTEHLRTAYVLEHLPLLPAHYSFAAVASAPASDVDAIPEYASMGEYAGRAPQITAAETQHLRDLERRIRSLAGMPERSDVEAPALRRLVAALGCHNEPKPEQSREDRDVQ